jgi:tetratricopeptide (TPR) repeat protein
MESTENTAALILYATFYVAAIDGLPQAIRLYTNATERDPLHPGLRSNLAMMLLFAGDAKTASHYALEALELNPGHENATALLIRAYTELGNFQAAQRLLDQIQQQPRFREMMVGQYYAERGDEEKARKIYKELLDNPPLHRQIILAVLALALGEVEQGIDLMEYAVDDKSFRQFWIRPLFRQNDAVKNHPRYLALLKRIGLDDESVAELHSRMSFE